MGRDVLGEWGYAMGIVGLFVIISELGFSQAHVKKISEGRDPAVCLGTYLAVKVGLTLLMLLLTGAYLFVQVVVLDKPFVSTTTGTVVIVLLYYTFTSLRAIGGVTFDAKRETAKSQLVVVAEHFVRLPLTAVVTLAFAASAFGTGPLASYYEANSPELFRTIAANGAEFLALTYTGAALASLLVAALLLRGERIARPDTGLLREYSRFAWPIFLGGILATLSGNVDKVALGFFWSETEVGNYTGVQRISSLINMVPTAVGILLFPTLSDLHSRNELDGVSKVTGQALRYISMLLFPVCVFTIAFAVPVIHVLLSDEFLAAAPTLALLTLYVLIFSLSYPYENLLFGANKPHLAVMAGATIFTTNIVLNLLFIPSSLFGYPLPGLKDVGAALATVVSMAVGFLVLRRAATTVTRFPSERFMFSHLSASVIMVIPLFYFAQFVGGDARFFTLILLALVGGVIYVVTLRLLGALTDEDIAFFKALMSPGAAADYMRDELTSKRKGPD